MEAETTATIDEQNIARDDYVDKLQEVFATTFSVWRKSSEDLWEPVAAVDSELEIDSSQLDLAIQEQHSRIVEICPGRYFLVVPLPTVYHRLAKKAAVATIETNSPEFLCQLAESSIHSIEQQNRINQLIEENAIFLQQVSEDFEELAFLRSMAERLVLGKANEDLSYLINHTLPLLGDAAGIESLYFLQQADNFQIQIANQWHRQEGTSEVLEHSTLESVVALFHKEAAFAPVVRNHVDEGNHASRLPGVREFILVEVSTHGWILAVNRRPSQQETIYEPICKLSQNELGTNEASLINTAAAMLASHAHNLSLLDEREKLLVNMVRTLVSAIDSRDPYTCGHSERVARYGKCLAAAIGFNEEACERLYLTGLLHDIGKIGVSDAVLNKRGALTDEEFAEIQKHPDLGWAILRELEQLQYVLPGVLHHHERFDGRGYPDRLLGHQTPIDGRLLAVVDAFDAMTSDRPYRQGMPVEKAVSILQEGAGSQWDAELVRVFIETLPDILEIKDRYQRPPVPQREPAQFKDRDGALVAVP